MSRLHELKTFIVQIPSLSSQTYFPTSPPTWIYITLSNLSTSIQDIIIEVPVDRIDFSPNSDERIDWDAIDEVITPAQFPLLRNVALVVGIHHEYPAELKELAQAQLLKLGLFKRGILDIEFREPLELEVRSVAVSSLADEGQLGSRRGCFSGCTVQ